MSPLVRTRPSPTDADAAPRPTVAERVVARTAGVLSGGHSRRRFLARTAVVGSALVVNPITYLLKPGTAYGAVCGTCSDGWTAFCCTINNGSNSCPPATFVAGWWKADGSAYCGGGPRYIIDCNATCPTQCSCRCSGAACDGRRVCCNQFRYGQCNQQISCYGPVACRVAICITPWTYDPACSTYTLTDNRTADHGAACLSSQAYTPIGLKYQALGGAGGFLGLETQSERDTPDGTGRYAIYEGGRIYDSTATNPQEIHGSVLDTWLDAGATGSAYGYPTSDVSSSGDVRYSRFQHGAIYRLPDGKTWGVPEPYYSVYQLYGGINSGSALGYPAGDPTRSGDQRAVYINFQRGRIYRRSQVTVEIHGAIFDKHEALGGIYGALGHVQTNVTTLSDGTGRASIFEHGGVIYYTGPTGACGVWGDLLEAYLDDGGPTGRMGYPTSDRQKVGDDRGVRFTTRHGAVYSTSTTGAHVVPPPVFALYAGAGGPGGSYGYPTDDPERLVGDGVRQTFEGGTITVTSPQVAFVKASYEDFLGRVPTEAELDWNATALAGGAISRATYIKGLAASDEYLSALVKGFYQDTLGRDGSPQDIQYWVDRLRAGEAVSNVAAFFYSSQEYFAGIGGGTVRSWISDLYTKLLGRSATTGDLDYWEGEVASRGRTRVARDFYQSAESRAARVQKLYQALLGRSASDADASYWSARIATQGDLVLASTLASMQEYFDRSQDRFPG